MKTHLTINWANYPGYSPQRARQIQAFASLIGDTGCLPDWCDVSIALLPQNYLQDCPLVKSVEIVNLPRATEHDRRLPYVKDMLQVGMDNTDDKDDWIGIANSDIIYTPRFFELLDNPKGRKAIAGRAKDIVSGKSDVIPHDGGIDVFFIKRITWKRLEDGYPDMIFGENWWDVVMLGWMDRYRIQFTIVDDGLLHIQHVGSWKTYDGCWTSEQNAEMTAQFNKCEV